MAQRDLVLVLGATGYVGGRLVPELIQAGLPVRCLTRSARGLSTTEWAPQVEVVEGDLSDLSTIGAARVCSRSPSPISSPVSWPRSDADPAAATTRSRSAPARNSRTGV